MASKYLSDLSHGPWYTVSPFDNRVNVSNNLKIEYLGW